MESITTDAAPVRNVTGATLFVGYVLAALFLSILIVNDLYQSYQIQPSASSSKAQGRLQIFVALAVLSFSTLSYHMLSYLIYAYQGWVTVGDLDALPSDLVTLSTWDGLRQIWQWLTESTLFLDFAQTICANSANFWWTQQALFVSMASALFIGIEGKASPCENKHTQRLIWLTRLLLQAPVGRSPISGLTWPSDRSSPSPLPRTSSS